MDHAKPTQAWNNFMRLSDPLCFQAGVSQRAAYISKTFMGLVCHGGLAFFVEVYSGASMPDVVRAQDQIGAARAARELDRVLAFAGASPPVEYDECLSPEAEAELEDVLRFHVLENLPCYLALGDAHE